MNKEEAVNKCWQKMKVARKQLLQWYKNTNKSTEIKNAKKNQKLSKLSNPKNWNEIKNETNILVDLDINKKKIPKFVMKTTLKAKK